MVCLAKRKVNEKLDGLVYKTEFDKVNESIKTLVNLGGNYIPGETKSKVSREAYEILEAIDSTEILKFAEKDKNVDLLKTLGRYLDGQVGRLIMERQIELMEGDRQW